MALLFALLVIPVAPPPSAEAAPIHYLYDPLGRLIAVVDLSAESAQAAIFRYDPVGNLIAITRQPANQASIIDFFPKSGPEGLTVCVLGTGFSATAGQNTVHFNGLLAPVVSATETEVCVSVPGGATTGPVSISTPSGSSTSTAPFTSAPSDAPSISAFTPLVGDPGTTVTVSGTNFDPIAANDRVTFNIQPSSPAAATATSLNVPVPANTGSGRITVATPNGEATSAADFFIPPTGFTASQVETTGRTSIGGPTVSIPTLTQGKIAIFVFDGLQGQVVNIGTGPSTIGGVVHVRRSDGSSLGSIGANDSSAQLTLPESGTYSVTFEPSATGNAAAILSEPIRGAIEIDGPAVPVSIDRRGQRLALTFQGTAGQFVGAAPVGAAFTVCCPVWGFLNPDGSVLAQTGISTDIDVTLPTTGIYTLALNAGTATGSASFVISTPVRSPITVDGPTVSVTTRHGQNARMPFSGSAGQRVSLAATGSTYPCCAVHGILNPDGSVLAQAGISVDVDVVLPTTGTYHIAMNAGNAAGSTDFTLTSPITGALPLDGTPTTLTFRPGQDARLTFSGVQGQGVGIGFRNIGVSATIALLKPDGTQLATACPGCGQDIDVVLPADGVYTLTFDVDNAVGSIDVIGSTEIVGAIAIDGPAVTPSPVSGQNARLTFDASAGQRLGIGFTNIAISGATVRLLDPSGTELGTACVGCAQTIAAQLAATGTHTIVVDANNASGSLTVWLSEEITGTLAVNGPSIPVAINRAGQDARYTFDGTAGEAVTVRVTGSTSGCEKVTLLDPQGTSLTSTSSCFSSYSLTPQTLTQSGIHTITVDPSGNATVNANLSVTSP